MAFLNKGLEIRFKDERRRPRPRAGRLQVRRRHRRLRQARQQDQGEPVLQGRLLGRRATTRPRSRSRSSGTPGYNTDGIHSFANGINTIEGGTHEEGFKAALTTAVNKYARAKNLLKEKDANLAGEDIREGITAIISVRLRDPQFEGQTKAKLGNTAMKTLVQKATNEKLGDWLEENPTEANKIVTKGIAAAQARAAAKKARDVVRNKTLLDGAGMPDKLKDCSSEEPRASASCSSSRATRPAARPSRPATPRPRRSCPSGARSSTSSGPASTRC